MVVDGSSSPFGIVGKENNVTKMMNSNSLICKKIKHTHTHIFSSSLPYIPLLLYDLYAFPNINDLTLGLMVILGSFL